MCAGGIDIAGLQAVVYSVPGGGLPAAEVFDAGRSNVEVVPDVLRDEGERVHEEYL
jgi:hypothetical protein